MKMMSLLLLIGSWAIAQDSLYRLPKYPPKLKMTTRDSGVRPGSPVAKNDPFTSSFRRTYAKPAGLRLLVRLECSSRKPSDKELIERAEAVSEAGGPPVQIDWETINGKSVRYYAVVYTEKTISSVDLTARNGVYEVARTSKSVTSDWQIHPLTFGSGGPCIRSEDLSQRGMRVAVINILNTATLAHFRDNASR